MVDAEAQTEAPSPAAVVGVEQDLLFGVRVRKSFGARAFWGSVVGCYWVSGGLFYKVSFDDGDVDLFSADEVLRDAQEAKKHAKENPQASNGARNEPLDAYFNAMRLHSLKRKRDDVVDCSVPNVRRVQLWGQRLYASIYTNERNETFIKEMLKTEDGGQGEMESTGHVQVGDMILAVNHTRVLGLPSRDLAEMIKKPKRPITLTFYRPQQARGEAEQATTTPAAQTQQPPALETVTPSSFLVPPPAFGNSTSAPPPPLPQWSQPLRAAMSEKEALQRSLLQSVAGRQGGYVPMGVAGPGNPVPNPGLMAHTQQYFQRFADAAAMRASAGFSIAPPQHARPMAMPPPQTSAPASRVEYYTGRNQRQRTTGSTLYHQVQQLQAQRNSTSASNTISSSEPRAVPTAHTRTNSAPIADARTSGEPRRTASSEPARNQPDASPNDESANERSSAEITSRENTRVQTSASTTSATAGTSTMTDRDVEAIAALAERDPMAAQRVWNGASSFLSPSDTSAAKNPKSPTTQSTSFLTPDGASSFLSPNDASLAKTSEASTASSTSFLTPNSASAEKSPTTVEHAAESASHSMSFLSPTDFNMEQTSMPTRQDLAATTSGQINSNVSVATVQVSRRRLYLTLGVQGTLIAVTSFVPDEVGRPGEVELSGKVLPGDVLVRVNATHIISGMTPSNVAEIVNAAPRPVTLWFERASWDILDGKA
ncbi:hypothetical protein PR003_g5200 [Phytophthora rubi]|uniref:PDZ domain-containing protein n=1 Tax=Phytophthora rubi TaxID=129364 RepID=A0A6A3KNL9_9STRA|nr:hypothetical protein PR002_g15763 [Phytophthora rubi]KAE9350796.1 hypothetical protein PR003_g5200 [Phytophthora rubi]